ncbi:uncharacterized protein LOC122511861 [Leptopilina heterotoma]|uniref:uncharacterized protein LOC122511861 n=1 Tax=Leptopilina heterotoma TaxID=63436 RepID=UPI001CA911EF|nr:uncharacterized protein LOC122511861 [Leptopilina heterotoma]
MRLKRIGSSLWMIIMPLLPLHAINAIDKESSDVYLKTVMNELQTFNNPLFHNQYEISSSSSPPDHSHSKISLRNGQKVGGGSIHNRYWKTSPDYYQFDYNQYPGNQISIKKIDNDFPIVTNNQGIVSRPQAINKSWKEEALGLTKIQLAAMYEKALQKGSPVGFAPLTTSLLAEQAPKVTSSNQLEIPYSPQYSYYFFPLKSFGNELRNNYGYKTIPDNVMQETKIMETNKEMTNPLFVAVSSFIGMALLFMMGVLIFPQVRNFIPRNQQNDDLLQLTKIVFEAIDNRRNPFMGRSRKNFTRKRNIVQQ